MKKQLLLLILVWACFPLAQVLCPQSGWLDQLGGTLYSQQIALPQDSTGFWDQLKSVLQRGKNAGVASKSVTEKYDWYYDWIHQEEFKLYDSLSKVGVVNWDRYQNIITLQVKAGNDSLAAKKLAPNIKMFGWHPYWMGSAFESYQFNLLSYVAWFSYNINPETGNYNNADVIRDWADPEKAGKLVELAHGHQCKVLLTITNHTSKGNKDFLTNPLAQQVLMDSLIRLIQLREADGVDVNFELVPDGLEEEMTLFLQALSQRLKGKNKDWVLSVDLPIYDVFGTYELDKLAEYVDLFIVTGYDYYNGKSRTDGPVAPLNAPMNQHSIRHSVNKYLQAGLKKEKLILGLPYYGAVWTAKSAQPGLLDSTLLFKQHMTYRALQAKYCINEPGFDWERMSRYYVQYNPDSSWYEKCWFDDSITLGRKFDWVLQQQLAGVGIWALGYDNGHTELWNMIRDKYASDTNLVYQEPYIESRYYNLSRSLMEYRSLIAVAGIFVVVFLLLGLVVALFDWRVREVFFQNKTLRLLYALAGISVLLSVYAFYLYVNEKPLFDENNLLALGIGLVLGVCATLYISHLFEKNRKSLP